jgi:hypothetical protein
MTIIMDMVAWNSHLTLFFALTARKPDLLETLFITYVSAAQFVRQCIHEQLPDLVRTLGNAYSFV